MSKTEKTEKMRSGLIIRGSSRYFIPPHRGQQPVADALRTAGGWERYDVLGVRLVEVIDEQD